MSLPDCRIDKYGSLLCILFGSLELSNTATPLGCKVGHCKNEGESIDCKLSRPSRQAIAAHSQKVLDWQEKCLTQPQREEEARREHVVKHKGKIVAICKKHNATNIRLFGSFIHYPDGKHNDLDVLVDMPSGYTLRDVAVLLDDLMKLLGCAVDVYTEGMFSAPVRKRVLSHARPIEEVL